MRFLALVVVMAATLLAQIDSAAAFPRVTTAKDTVGYASSRLNKPLRHGLGYGIHYGPAFIFGRDITLSDLVPQRAVRKCHQATDT
ncbi:hypothetical protein GOP47_0012693, partial [Adiantum capillus-veneris]